MFDMVPFRRFNGGVSKKGDYFDQLFNHFFSDDFLAPFSSIGSAHHPFRVDVQETEGSYLVEADLPGVKKEDISIAYENNYLSISAKREENREEKSENYIRQERAAGQFRRTFYIDNIDPDGIDASFQEGVLKVTLPKTRKDSQKKSIEIH
jgi:HSP20 family protein